VKLFQKEMEVNNQQEGESHPRVPATQSEALSLELIRTETVLSRMPVHNLAKQGRVNIQIVKTTPTGEVELKWEVSYSERYGQARQLAYKLDTIIVNQRIDEAGRPLPKLLRIGSLNEICAELNLATHAGQNTKDLKRAFLQNASAFITAKFNYRANDGTERRVEAGVTRYGVIFTGEKLPDGRKADAVYISFNDPFWEVLNNAPVRPLDRTYMKELPPAAQRFYEIISRKIFAALKNDYASAKISYSEYCTFSAQLRHFERQRVQDQMAKVLRPHKASGYITAVRYEPTIDAQSQPDWILYLTPGPKAHAEFAAAHTRRKVLKQGDTTPNKPGESQQQRHPTLPRRAVSKVAPAASRPKFDPVLVAEFTRRGITEEKALEILAEVKPDQDVVAQLEHYDQLIEHAGFRIKNPPGFYIRLIEKNIPVPDGFETRAKRKAREEAEQRKRNHRAAEDARELLELEYARYCDAETERYILEHSDIFSALKDAKLQEEREHPYGLSFESAEATATRRAKWEIREQVPLLTLEQFVEGKKQGTDFFLKPVGPSPAAELTTEPARPEDILAADEARESEHSKPVMAPEEATADSVHQPAPELAARKLETEAPVAKTKYDDDDSVSTHAVTEASTYVEPAPESAMEPSIVTEVQVVQPEPLMIDLVSNPPHDESGSSSADQGIA
jgi:hypothetical protein